MNAPPAELSKHQTRECVSSGSVWVYDTYTLRYCSDRKCSC